MHGQRVRAHSAMQCSPSADDDAAAVQKAVVRAAPPNARGIRMGDEVRPQACTCPRGATCAHVPPSAAPRACVSAHSPVPSCACRPFIFCTDPHQTAPQHTHARAHTHTHTHTNTRTRARAHTHTHAKTRKHMQTSARTHAHTSWSDEMAGAKQMRACSNAWSSIDRRLTTAGGNVGSQEQRAFITRP